MDNIMNTDTDTDTDNIMEINTDIIMTVYENVTPYLNTACTCCSSYVNEYI